MAALILVFIVGWAFRDAWLHATGRLRESRQARIAEREAELAPRKMSPRQKRATAARHDTGWWWREAMHGFPVTTYGWKAGWTAHKTAHEQGRQAHRAEKARLAEVRKQGRASTLVTDVDPSPAQSQGQQSPVPPAAPAPLSPAPGAAGRPGAGPSPQTPAPGAPRPAAGPQPAAAGEPAPPPAVAVPPKSQNPEPSPAPASPVANGVPMATGTTTSEYTYDQTIDTLNQLSGFAEASTAELDRLGIPQMTDQLSVSGLDRGNLAHIADVAAAHDQVREGWQKLLDSATAARDSIQRDHGPVAEAHQAAPEGGAEKPFYAGV